MKKPKPLKKVDSLDMGAPPITILPPESVKAIDLRKTPYFAFPSTPVMLSLLAMFAGKPERIPRFLLEKSYSDMTPAEKQEADSYTDSILEKETYRTPQGAGFTEQSSYTAIIADNPKVRAEARITDSLFSEDLSFQETSLAVYVKTKFRAEGLRHLLALIVGLEESGRSGYMELNLSEHLERMGYQQHSKGGFRKELKKKATEIIRAFVSFTIACHRKNRDTGVEMFSYDKLFNLEGLGVEVLDKEVIKETLKLSATNFWYKNAIAPDRGTAQYTKLLKQVAKENHQDHPLTIFLTPLLAIFWRINPEGKKLSLLNVMEWCNLDHTQGNSNRDRDLKTLESELDYMVHKGYMGAWNSNKAGYPSLTDKPFEKNEILLELKPPEWLKKEIKAIKDKQDIILLDAGASRKKPLTIEQFIRVMELTGRNDTQFAGSLGMNRAAITMIRKREKVSKAVTKKIREAFPEEYQKAIES